MRRFSSKHVKAKALVCVAMAGVFLSVASGSVGVPMGGSMAFAAEKGNTKPSHQDWGFKGAFGTYDRASMQRGYQVYREVCAACHALEHLSFRHLGDEGAPYYDSHYPNPSDNPAVKAFASDWDVEIIDSETGDTTTRPGIPADKFPSIYANDIQARAVNNGALPVDLSLIVKAREGGADYLYDLLVSYTQAPDSMSMQEGMHYNTAFEGGQIAMPIPFVEEQVEYQTMEISDGHGGIKTVAAPYASTEQMARDVVEFLAWSSDPKMEVRKRTGFATMLYLLILSLLLYATYKQVWHNVKH